jgi:hypothetical protein
MAAKRNTEKQKQTTALTTQETRDQLIAVLQERVDITAMKAEAVELADKMKNLVIASDDADAAGADLGLLAKRTFEAGEETRKRILAPAKAFADEVNTAFSFTKTLSAQIDDLRSRIGAYRTKKAAEAREAERKRQEEAARLERERQELIRKQQEEARKKNAPPPIPPPPINIPAPTPQAANTVSGKIGESQGRLVWKFHIDDIALVPDSFKTVNEKAIGAAVRAGTRSIPGVRIYSEQSVAFTGR